MKPATGATAWGAGRVAATAAGSLCLALMAGCTVPVEAPPSTPPRPAPAAPEPADAERRAQVRLELAAAYFGRGQFSTALDEIRLALAARPDMPEAWNLRALAHAALGDAPQAEESFRRALQLNPRDGGTLHNHGWFLCQQGRFADAEAQFQAALAQPQYRDVVRTLLAQGVCHARAGRWPEAERTLSRCYELDPTSAVTAFNLSDVLYRRGDYARARFYIQRVNAVPEQTNAQTLWLAARIENRTGNTAATQALGRQLRERFPQSPEALQFERGRFDD